MQTRQLNQLPIIESRKWLILLSIFSILSGLFFSFLLYKISYPKGIFLMLGFLAVGLIFRHPEFGLVLSFSSGIFKEWLSLNVPIFAQFDFTIAIFGLTLISIFYFLLKKGTLFDISFDQSFWPLILFSGFMLFSTLYTPSFKYGIFKAFSFLFFNWCMFLFPILMIRDEKYGWRITYLLIALAVAVSIFAIVSLIQGFLKQTLLFTYRASFLGINPISFAGWVGVINILLISIMPEIKQRKWRTLAIVSIVILSVAVLVANSRGPLVSFIFTVFLILLFKWKNVPKHKIFLLLTVLILSIVIVLNVLPPQLTSRYTETIQQEGATKYVTFYTVHTRLSFWLTCLRSATDNLKNLFVGAGSGAFSMIFYGLDVRHYPHNIFMEVLCEFGLVGIILLVWHFMTIFKRSIRTFAGRLSHEQKTLLFAYLMATVFYFVAAQFSGDLNDNRRLWFFLGNLVAIISLPNFKKRAFIRA